MPNGNEWDDEEDDDDAFEQVSESDLIKQLRKQVKQSNKKIAQLETENKGFAQTQREKIAQEVLEKKGVNPKAARLLLKELDEVSEKTIEAWLKDNDDLFAPLKPAEEKTPEELANLEELSRQDGTAQSAGTPAAGNDVFAAMEKMSGDELRAFLKNQ